MRAMAVRQYGGPDALELIDLPAPKLGPDIVLIRARAAGVNPVDCAMREGWIEGWFHLHLPLIPGWDVAGTVEAVGVDVTEFSPGDEVIAYARRDHVQWGTYAELVAAPLRTVAHKPASIGWAEASAIPLAGLTAWQALTRGLDIQPGDVVLVHAAAGGVGTFAVQLARFLGASVIGTAGESNHEYLSSLGAQPVLYGEGLADRVRSLAPEGVTAALDLAGGEALDVTPSLLAEGGRFASVIDPGRVAELGGRYVFVRPSTPDLTKLSQLIDEGALGVHLMDTFPLEKAADAHVLLQGRHVRGKVALEIS